METSYFNRRERRLMLKKANKGTKRKIKLLNGYVRIFGKKAICCYHNNILIIPLSEFNTLKTRY